MSANFYHDDAGMLGPDVHKYWVLIPPVIPKDVLTVYVAGARNHQPPMDDKSALVASVTSSRHQMVQGRCKLTWIIHIPIPLGVPHPIMEPLEYGIILSSSSSTPLVRRQTVTAAGLPLACCLSGAWGLNVNCWEGIKLPSGVVHAENTVMTQPTLADVIDALVEIVIDLIAGAALKGLARLPWFKELLQKGKTWITRILEKAIKDFLKDGMKDILKDILKKRIKAQVDGDARARAVATLDTLGVTHV